MSAAQEPADTVRRRLTRRLFFGLPLLGAALAARPQVASAGTASSTWKMEGNSDVDDNDFIGSKNDKSLVFKTKNVERLRITNTGRVGVNIASPSASTLQVNAQGGTAIRGDSGSTDATATGVWGQLTAATPGSTATGAPPAGVRGVVATTAVNTGVGVYGAHAGGGAGVVGVNGANAPSVNSTNYGAGVVGYGESYGVVGFGRPSYDGGTVGVYGIGGRHGTGVVGDSYRGVGVMARANGGFCYALVAEMPPEEGNIAAFGRITGDPFPGFGGSDVSPGGLPTGVAGRGAFGVVGESNGNGVGVYGTAGAEGYAGFFAGRVVVAQELIVGQDGYNLDPQRVVTSPEQLSVYSGNVVLNAAGQAAVTLPATPRTFTDVRYQLTPIGAAAPGLYVAQELADGTFTIAGGTAGLKVSWRVEAAQG